MSFIAIAMIVFFFLYLIIRIAVSQAVLDALEKYDKMKSDNEQIHS